MSSNVENYKAQYESRITNTHIAHRTHSTPHTHTQTQTKHDSEG